jgi:hypothetical protein
MEPLNLPEYHPVLSKRGEKVLIYDPLRRRAVALTPEEWVRQHFVNYLLTERAYPMELLANEVGITLNGLTKRCDTVIYDRYVHPLAIVEYKAPSVTISQRTIDQIVRYNITLRVGCLMISNGLNHYCCCLDTVSGTFVYLKEIPLYENLGNLLRNPSDEDTGSSLR